MSALLYLFGQPGSGKSTLVEALTEGQMAMPYREDGLALIDWVPAQVTELGARRESFSGTDALSMSAITKAVPWLGWRSSFSASFVLAEGDRLAVDRFFQAAVDVGYALELVYLDTPDELAAERRAARGSSQNEAWVRGRVTKARRLADDWQPFRLDGSKPVQELVADLKSHSEVAGRFA